MGNDMDALTQEPYGRFSGLSTVGSRPALSFSPNGKATMHEISLALGLTGKPEGIDGSEVASYFQAGRIKEIADYCETDVTNTYQIWLRYELFRGKLSEAQYRASEADLRAFILAHKETKPHFQYMVASEAAAPG
jgi:predicted PolB exonuclease-like 3'-5' exonuclease